MIKDSGEIRDDEIRIIGELMRVEQPANNRKKIGSKTLWTIVILLVIVVAIALVLAMNFVRNYTMRIEEPALFEANYCDRIASVEDVEYILESRRHRLGRIVDKDVGGFCEIKDTIINDISFNIFIPHNATMSLHVGAINHNDKDIVYATQAADVRADNGGIVGAFVLKGKPLAWGLSKKGYCASIDGNVTVGVAENSPLFEEATEKDGYFFRQYPLVKDGYPMLNDIRGKSVRRAICDRNGEIFMVATSTPESFHDFIQALVDLGVDQAVYLVGSMAIGWAVEEDGTLHEWGNKITDLRYSLNRSSTRSMPRNTSYIVWKKQ